MNKAENCVSFLGGRRCKRLKVKECDSENCAFYRTDTEEKIAQENAVIRLRALSEDMQLYIADKYYKGKMPWLKRRDCR